MCCFLGWKKCLSQLINNKDWFDAMSFALDVYQGKVDLEYDDQSS